MYEQTNKPDPLVVATVGAIALVYHALRLGIWAIGRAGYLIKSLAPLYGRRLAEDLSHARRIFAGHNDQIIAIDAPSSQINRYHTRYEGTDRAAKDEGKE